ncbi:hypothetical protein GCM10027578_00160 [Spirosoma luteolum]
MPPDWGDLRQRASAQRLAQAIQHGVGPRLRVLRVDTALHPEIMTSFDIHVTPAFVLVQHGTELWRQEGSTDPATLTHIARQLLTT